MKMQNCMSLHSSREVEVGLITVCSSSRNANLNQVWEHIKLEQENNFGFQPYSPGLHTWHLGYDEYFAFGLKGCYIVIRSFLLNIQEY